MLKHLLGVTMTSKMMSVKDVTRPIQWANKGEFLASKCFVQYAMLLYNALSNFLQHILDLQRFFILLNWLNNQVI